MEFKVGDRVAPKSTFAQQVIYTIKALGEPGINGYPAWVTTPGSSTFGAIIDLEYVKHYFKPGYYRLKFSSVGDVSYYKESPGDNYERVNVTIAKEEDSV